jgi:hypothetical protein
VVVLCCLLQNMGGKGVQRIETAVGNAFDPNTMEAMTTTPCPGGDAKPGSIANIWQVRCTASWWCAFLLQEIRQAGFWNLVGQCSRLPLVQNCLVASLFECSHIAAFQRLSAIECSSDSRSWLLSAGARHMFILDRRILLAASFLVLQSGYKIHDRVLRAAKVIVYQE